MSFPDNPRDLKFWLAFGHTDAEDLSTVNWTQVAPNPNDEGDPGPVMGPIRIRRGRIGDAGSTDPTQFEFGLRNTGGEFSRRNVTGPHYGQLRQGTPAKVTVDLGSGDQDLATAGVQDFTPERDGPNIDLRVPGRVVGVLSRIGRDQRNLSPLARAILGAYDDEDYGYYTGPYWSMEDGAQASGFASTSAGGAPLTVTGGVQFAADDTLGGSEPLPVLAAATKIVGTMTHTPSPDGWAFAWVAKFPNGVPSSSFTLMDLAVDGGTAVRWVLTADATTLELNGYDSGGNVIFTASTTNPAHAALFSGEWVGVSIVVSADAEEYGFTVARLDGSASGTVQLDTLTAGALTGFTIPSSSELDGASIGHIAATSAPYTPSWLLPVPGQPSAPTAYDGEEAATRAARLLTQAGYPTATPAGDSPKMGPQPTGAILPLLRSCEDVDGGVLYETRGGKPAFQPQSTRYNADVALTLAYGEEDGSGTVHNLVMVDDDRDVYNLVTVTLQGGSPETVEQETGPVGTDPSEGIGPRPMARTLNLHSPDQTVHHAGWLLRLGTVDKPRYRVVLSPYTVASLRAASIALDFGSRVQITGAPPEDHGPDTLDLIVEGEEIEIDSDVWTVALWCEPYAPYQVNVLAEDDPGDDTGHPIGWLEADSCVLAAPVDEDDTSWSMTCDPEESSDPDDYPIDFFVAGERITVTASTGGASPTWTVTRSVNGVSKSHTAGTSAVLADPIYGSIP